VGALLQQLLLAPWVRQRLWHPQQQQQQVARAPLRSARTLRSLLPQQQMRPSGRQPCRCLSLARGAAMMAAVSSGVRSSCPGRLVRGLSAPVGRGIRQCWEVAAALTVSICRCRNGHLTPASPRSRTVCCRLPSSSSSRPTSSSSTQQGQAAVGRRQQVLGRAAGRLVRWQQQAVGARGGRSRCCCVSPAGARVWRAAG
jgi:hypothetical protein